MMLSDDDVIARIRDTLTAWAEEAPVAEAGLTPLTSAPNVARLRPRRTRWIAIAAAVAAAAVFVAVIVVRRAEQEPAGPTPPPSVTEITVGTAWGVRGLAADRDAIWATSVFDKMLYRIDPATNAVTATFPIPDHVEGVVAAGGWLWLTRYDPNEVVRLDPASGAVDLRLSFDSQPSLATDGTRLVAVGLRGETSVVVDIDPATGAEHEVPFSQGPGFAAIDGDRVWVVDLTGTTLTGVDLAGGDDVKLDLAGSPRGVVFAEGSVWVAVNGGDVNPPGALVRIDPATATIEARIPVGRYADGVAAGAGRIWVTDFEGGTLSAIDPTTNTMVATTPIADRPGAVVAAHDSIWVVPHRRNALVRIDPDQPLEPAAMPDVARSVAVASGTVYIQCSGSGSPTVVLESNEGFAGRWATVEARLAQHTRVCSYDRAIPVGAADAVAADLDAALHAIGEQGPFVMVGEWIGALYAEAFTAAHRDQVEGLVLVSPMSSDYLERIGDILPADVLATIEGDPATQELAQSAASLAALSDFGDLPLVVLRPALAPAWPPPSEGQPTLTADQQAAIDALVLATQAEVVDLSTDGSLVATRGAISPQDVVDAVLAILGR